MSCCFVLLDRGSRVQVQPSCARGLRRGYNAKRLRSGPSSSTPASEAAEPQGLRGGVVVLATFAERLRSLRGPGESYSDVILRLAAGETQRGRSAVRMR